MIIINGQMPTSDMHSFSEVAGMICNYIKEKKGVQISGIMLDDTPKSMELFLKAANVAMTFYGR